MRSRWPPNIIPSGAPSEVLILRLPFVRLFIRLLLVRPNSSRAVGQAEA
jgi:hypothetical protein